MPHGPGAQVGTPAQLDAALEAAGGEAAGKLCLIEVKLHHEDCSRELLEWGARLAAYNARPPQVH